ncbi:MAG TPA: glycine cleavage T C-terminal barrel domain-containing protein [Pirellula sp.]|nr:glycine cleavage T C-terminal barrel domain-containing protein [Pirellula sp.]
MPKGYHLGKGSVIRFQGSDRCRVFNNLCTQDLRSLADGQAYETFITDVKGRTFGHGIAMSVEGEAFFISVPDQGGKLVPHFDHYIIREDAVLTDVSSDYQFWLFRDGVVAADAFAIARELAPGAKEAIAIDWVGKRVILLHTPWVGPDSILGLVPSACSDQVMVERLGDDWCRSEMVVRSAWEFSRIQAFWPWYGIDLDDRHLPQEVNRDGSAISFNKGCYLGQETIARLDMLGKVQKKLVKLIVDSNDCPKAQAAVQSDGKDVGRICSSALDSTTDRYVALAYIKRSHFTSGQVLSVDGDPATVS